MLKDKETPSIHKTSIRKRAYEQKEIHWGESKEKGERAMSKSVKGLITPRRAGAEDKKRLEGPAMLNGEGEDGPAGDAALLPVSFSLRH